MNQNQPMTNQQLSRRVTSETEVLFRARSVFPFDMFPDEVVVDKTKVSVISKIFFFSEVVQSVAARDILSVTVESNPILAKVTIIGRMPQQAAIVIRNLWTKDAEKLRGIIQGLAIASSESMHIDQLPKSEQLPAVEELGATNSRM